MTRLHAPSPRKLLLASGGLFAWAYLPKLARAEGRDPRFLTVVLRGALDGLATVAPVGERSGLAFAARRQCADARQQGISTQARRFLRAQSSDAESAPYVQSERGDCRPRRCYVLSRALAFRWPGRARERG